MSGKVADKKRLFRITAGNLRNNHIYINGHYDFFPKNCFGPSKRGTQGAAHEEIEIYLDGLGETVSTDISSDRKTGKPRNFFRRRAWVRRFFQYHHIKTGDVLAMERLGERSYRLYPFDAKANRETDWHWILDEPLEGNAPTVLELFAGCGGMLLGFKNSGFQTVLANE